VFVEGKYTARGKWMDGWETRRRREPGHDWCIIQLGVTGVIRAITVDTNHFRGNYPESCSLEAAVVTRALTAPRLAALREGWVEILPRSPLQGHAENRFDVSSDPTWSHVRLNIFPDGGVARLRVWGEARPDWGRLARRRMDLAAALSGGVPLSSSDEFFGEPLNLLLPGRPRNMGDGWETRRRRGPGHDWVIVRLGRRGHVDAIEVDTTHFKGNFPDSASVEGADASGPAIPDQWQELVPRAKLRANAKHRFRVARRHGSITHVRLNIFPDGGVARLKVWGYTD
jgi:allantoicase